jgi:hypothetical protein
LVLEALEKILNNEFLTSYIVKIEENIKEEEFLESNEIVSDEILNK